MGENWEEGLSSFILFLFLVLVDWVLLLFSFFFINFYNFLFFLGGGFIVRAVSWRGRGLRFCCHLAVEISSRFWWIPPTFLFSNWIEEQEEMQTPPTSSSSHLLLLFHRLQRIQIGLRNASAFFVETSQFENIFAISHLSWLSVCLHSIFPFCLHSAPPPPPPPPPPLEFNLITPWEWWLLSLLCIQKEEEERNEIIIIIMIIKKKRQ